MRKKVLLCMALLMSFIGCYVSTATAFQSCSGNFSTSYTLTGNYANDIVSVANAQIGKTQSNLGYTESWCADFVMDCARLTGMPDSVIPYNTSSCANVTSLYNTMINNCGAQVVSSPQSGDVIFYNCSSCGLRHVGIVASNTSQSIEGNNWTYGYSQVEKINSAYAYLDCGHTPIRIYLRPNYSYSSDTTSPTISNVRVTDKTKDGYTVRCHVEDNVGVESVRFPTWYEGLDANWLYGTNDGNGEWSCRINVSDFNSKTDCTYYTHIYAYDAAGNSAGNGSVAEYIETTPPTISDVKVYRTTTGYMVRCKVSDNYSIDRVQFPTWTDANGQDDILSDWYSNSAASGTISGDTVSFEVKISDHNNETGTYITHIYAFDTCNNNAAYGLSVDVTFNDEKPTIEDVKITDIDDTGYTVSCKVSAANGINRVQFPTWTAKDGQDDIQDDWVYGAASSGIISDDGTVTYRVNANEHNNESGVYITHIYAYDNIGNQTYYRQVALVNSEGYSQVAEGIYNGSKYILFANEDALSFNNMSSYCELFGGHLATITSQAENTFIKSLVKQTSNSRFYIGGIDVNKNGNWSWLNGENWGYTNWGDGEPSGEEYCLEIHDDGAWNDVTSDSGIGFVCEIEGYPVFEITNNGTSADITNNGEERTATVIVADCDSGGVLTDVTASDITFAAGEKRTFMLGSGTHKVFVWDSLDGMKPLAEVE